MAQVRFTIGVPRAGSAARSAESFGGSTRMPRIEGGSAARQAEERRRGEDTPVRRSMSTIRVQAGPRAASAAGPVVAQDGVAQSAPSSSEVASLSGVPLRISPTEEVHGANQVDAVLEAAEVPPTAAQKLKSLVRSLFGASGN